jgi:arginase family enzyme
MSDWPRITDLIGKSGPADVALLGAPMEAGSVTPGRCDLAPGTVRQALRRFSQYDLVSSLELDLPLSDLGDVPVAGLMPADGFAPIRDAVERACAAHNLVILLGGNNAVTRPAAHGLGLPLDRVGLITLDAHFDMRGTAEGPRNGNPVRCLLEDGLPGRNIAQIGLAPFANTAAMHRDAEAAGIHVVDINLVHSEGIVPVLEDAADALDHVDTIMIDFDIDVIDRSQCPGAPGARPGGMHVLDFFAAARWLASHPKVKLVDLTEFDPDLDVADITALTAARWVCEIVAGYQLRGDS